MCRVEALPARVTTAAMRRRLRPAGAALATLEKVRRVRGCAVWWSVFTRPRRSVASAPTLPARLSLLCPRRITGEVGRRPRLGADVICAPPLPYAAGAACAVLLLSGAMCRGDRRAAPPPRRPREAPHSGRQRLAWALGVIEVSGSLPSRVLCGFLALYICY